MAKGAYIGVSSKAHKIKKGYIGVGGKAHKIKKAYIGDSNGKARLWWSGSEFFKLFVSKQLYSNDNGDTFYTGARNRNYPFLNGSDIYASTQGNFIDNCFISPMEVYASGSASAEYNKYKYQLTLSYIPKDSLTALPTLAFMNKVLMDYVYRDTSTSGYISTPTTRASLNESENSVLFTRQVATGGISSYYGFEIISPTEYRSLGLLNGLTITSFSRITNPIYHNGKWYFTNGSNTYYTTDLINGTPTLLGSYGTPVGFATSRGVLSYADNKSYLLNNGTVTELSIVQNSSYSGLKVPFSIAIELPNGVIVSVERGSQNSYYYGLFAYLEPNSTTWKTNSSFSFYTSVLEYVTASDEKAFLVTDGDSSGNRELYYTTDGKTFTRRLDSLVYGSGTNISGLIYAHKGGYYHE